MDFFNFMLIVVAIAGVMVIVYALLSAYDEENDKPTPEEEPQNVAVSFDYKYQELLVLYNLIDEKKENLGEKSACQNPKFPEILRLAAKGFSVFEISKQLEIGEAEVSFVLNPSGKPTRNSYVKKY